MALNEKDLESIKDIVEFAIEKSEQRMELKFDKKLDEVEERIVTKINREITDIAETSRAFLAKIENHEHRIGRLETKTGLKTT